ncbi:uncharacterized protein PG986_003770 [Apiospora aurea]|uniref:Uncharacterized protein n=1 Tax=Apiospora aurea TaxID=335848 RepID=A0ABR1QSM4_9PEZI
MKVVISIASLLAAIAAAMPANADSGLSGREMVQYCSAINMGGACTTLNESVMGNCVRVPRSGGCGLSGLKSYPPGTYDDVDDKWKNSRAIDCHAN